MTSPAHKFDLRTITFDNKPPIRANAFCYAGLGALRIDSLAPHVFQGHEVWGIVVLRNNTLFPAVPVFRNIDDATGFIWDVSGLLSWEQEYTIQQLQTITEPLVQISMRYYAYPFEPFIESVLSPEECARFSVPIPSGLGPR